MDFILAPAIVGIVTFGIYKLFELFVCRRERLTIIEKMNERITMTPFDELSLERYLPNSRLSYGALKAGCLFIGIGLGLLVAFIICANCIPAYFDGKGDWQFRQIIGIVYGSCVLLFGGIGLITAFIIELKISKKKDL